MELDDQSPESPQSPKKNISDEIRSLRNEINQDNDRIMKYTDKITNANSNNQDGFEDYLDMIEYYEKQRNENLELLKTKIQELLNHPLNTINPSEKKRGGTKKHRRKNKNKNKNKRKRTMRL